MAEAKRIRVKIEYEVVRRVATMIQRREPTLINVTQKYNIDPVGPNAQYQYDALPKLPISQFPFGCGGHSFTPEAYEHTAHEPTDAVERIQGVPSKVPVKLGHLH